MHGEQLRRGFEAAVAEHRLQGYVDVSSRDRNLLFAMRDAEKKPSQAFRTLFMQELVREGVIAPSFVVSWSHTVEAINCNISAAERALPIYRCGLDEGTERQVLGPKVKLIFGHYA